MKLSIVIPAYNEESSIEKTVRTLYKTLQQHNIDHEILVINDNSTDNTEKLLAELKKSIGTLKHETNKNPNGYGHAVRYGLERFSGDCVAIMMADLSDSTEDLVRFYNTMKTGNPALPAGGYDCVFGSRFIKEGKATDYPLPKLILNRVANNFIRLVFGIKYNDCTNAFKLYKREVIDGLKPFLSSHYNLTLEMPLKAIVRGYRYAVLPNSWINRQHGISKFKIKEMGSRYLVILFNCLCEKYFGKISIITKPA